MNRMIDDLIQAAAPDSNTLQLVLGEINLYTAIQSSVAQVSALQHEKNITLRLNLPEAPILVNSDSVALRRVFAGLLENAVVVTHPGGLVSLSARLESMEGTISAEEQGYVLVQIADSGEGINLEDMPRLFSPQLGDTPPAGDGRPGSASSVDLAAIKTLVEALGGRIWVDSESGMGATFSVLLPVSSTASTRESRRGE
jgi:signal transduction histidine kinase